MPMVHPFALGVPLMVTSGTGINQIACNGVLDTQANRLCSGVPEHVSDVGSEYRVTIQGDAGLP